MTARVTINDFRLVGVCKDARVLFFQVHGLDWRDFVRNGIEPEVLRATGDQEDLVEQCIAAAERRVAREA